MADPAEKIASDGFTALVNEFFEDIAPDFSCSVCGNETFVIEYQDPRSTFPVSYRSSPSGNLRTFRRVWLCVCDRCGNTYTFHKNIIDIWAQKNGRDIHIYDAVEADDGQ